MALLAFCLQVLVPAGFMPASLEEDGALVKLCHHGMLHNVVSAGLSAELSAELSGDDAHHNSVGAQNYCDYGAVKLLAEWLVVSPSMLRFRSFSEPTTLRLVHIASNAPTRGKRSRAPPSPFV